MGKMMHKGEMGEDPRVKEKERKTESAEYGHRKGGKPNRAAKSTGEKVKAPWSQHCK